MCRSTIGNDTSVPCLLVARLTWSGSRSDHSLPHSAGIEQWRPLRRGRRRMLNSALPADSRQPRRLAPLSDWTSVRRIECASQRFRGVEHVVRSRASGVDCCAGLSSFEIMPALLRVPRHCGRLFAHLAFTSRESRAPPAEDHARRNCDLARNTDRRSATPSVNGLARWTQERSKSRLGRFGRHLCITFRRLFRLKLA